MSGLTGFLVILCVLQYSDCAVTFTGPTPVTGTTSATASVSVVETSEDAFTLFTVTATTDVTPGGTVAFAFTAAGNPDAIASSTITAGAVKLATSKTLDFETKKTYTLTITGTDNGTTPATSTLVVTVTVTNKLEFALATNAVCVADGTVAATVIGTYTVTDAVTGTDNVTYSNTPTTDLTVDTSTGALKVAAGRTLTSATTGGYTTTITATAATKTGSSAAGTTAVKVTVGGCSGAGQVQFMAILLLIPLLLPRVF